MRSLHAAIEVLTDDRPSGPGVPCGDAVQGVPLRGIKRAWRPRTAMGPVPAGLGLVDRVMLARGLSGAQADAFLSPSLMHLHDPGLLPGIDRAAGRILEAANAGEPIAIFGDYDVDGITATAILFHTLRVLSPQADVRTYVPHRLEEGYGLSTEALLGMAAQGVRVVVSVDCGITACVPARAAAAAGLDLIITDHHTPPSRGEDLPEASKKIAAFLVGLLGGPPQYRQLYGNPAMRARHLPFVINDRTRQVWLDCFKKVLADAPQKYNFPEEHLPGFIEFLDGFSEWMVNRK